MRCSFRLQCQRRRPSDERRERIEETVRTNDVVLFMKGTELFPQCGFSSRAVAILEHLGVPFKTVDVLQDADIRQGIKAYSDWPTIPQLYVKGEFVGGIRYHDGNVRERRAAAIGGRAPRLKPGIRRGGVAGPEKSALPPLWWFVEPSGR